MFGLSGCSETHAAQISSRNVYPTATPNLGFKTSPSSQPTLVPFNCLPPSGLVCDRVIHSQRTLVFVANALWQRLCLDCQCQDPDADSGCEADVPLEGDEREGTARDCLVSCASGRRQSAELGRTRTEGYISPTWEMGKRNHSSNVTAVQSFGAQSLPAFGFRALVVGNSSAEAFLCWWRGSFQRADMWGRMRLPPRRDCSISWSWASSHRGSGGSYVDVKWFPVTLCSCVLPSPVGGKNTNNTT